VISPHPNGVKPLLAKSQERKERNGKLDSNCGNADGSFTEASEGTEEAKDKALDHRGTEAQSSKKGKD
jgi:hypothetical protein